MAYRNNLEALQARHTALVVEVAERTRVRDEVGRLLVDARVLADAERQFADRAVGGPQRRRRRRWLIASAIALFTLVAGGIVFRIAQPKRDPFEATLKRLEGFTDEMCRCSNTQCAQQVSDSMTKWSVEMAKEWKNPPKVDEETTKRATEIGTRLGNCMVKAMSVSPEQAQAQPAGSGN
jgi:hypothetical protein